MSLSPPGRPCQEVERRQAGAASPVARVGACELWPPGDSSVRGGVAYPFPTVRPASSDRLPGGRGFEVTRADPFHDGMTWIALAQRVG
jgi:hypothetical protein